MIAVFLAANAGIVLGYYSSLLGFGWLAITEVYSKVPVLAVSALAAPIPVVSALAAHLTPWVSRANFTEGSTAISGIAAYILVFVALPDGAATNDMLLDLRVSWVFAGIPLATVAASAGIAPTFQKLLPPEAPE